MEPLVVIAAVIIALFAVIGFREGVVRRLVEIAGALLTILLTARFAARLTPPIMDMTGWSEGPALLTGWVLLIIIGFLLSRVLAVLLSKAVRLTILGWVDRVGGLVCGALFGLIVASLLVNIVAMIAGDDFSSRLRDHPSGGAVLEAAPSIAHQARLIAGDEFAELWETVRQETDQRLEEAREEAARRAEDAREEVEEAAREAGGG